MYSTWLVVARYVCQASSTPTPIAALKATANDCIIAVDSVTLKAPMGPKYPNLVEVKHINALLQAA